MISMELKNLDPGYRTMIKVENDLLRDLGFGVEELANLLVSEIRGNWSLNAPSSRGNPPAIVTGNLDSSVKVEEQGRDTLGRFASPENTVVKFVRVDTSEGDNPDDRGNYAPILEGALEREFIQPAIDIVAPMTGAIMKRQVKI